MAITPTTDTTTAAKGWAPDVVAFAPTDSVPNALALKVTTVVTTEDLGDAPVVHVPFVADAWAAQVVAEGAATSAVEPQLAEVALHQQKLSRLVTISREQFRKPQTAGQLAMSIGRDLTAQLDYLLVAASSGSVSPGLLHSDGVLDAAAPINGNLDPLVNLIGQLETNGADSDALSIVVSPKLFAAIQTLKVATGWSSYLLGSGVEGAAPRLLGKPVYKSRFLPASTGLVIDAASLPSAISPVFVAQSDQFHFANDQISVRASMRFAFKSVVRVNPDGSPSIRHGRFQVTGVTDGSGS